MNIIDPVTFKIAATRAPVWCGASVDTCGKVLTLLKRADHTAYTGIFQAMDCITDIQVYLCAWFRASPRQLFTANLTESFA
jgi:hypothetical protein